MLEFYFSKGSSALAAHILLLETGVDFEAIEVSIAKSAHLQPAFLRRNPKGRVPALGTPLGIITENPAILEYIATLQPQAPLMPEGAFAQAQCRSLCAYLCATAHVAAAHRHRGKRWAQQAASHQDMAAQVPGNLQACADFLETDLALAPWAFGADYSFCDPYLFQFTRWLAAAAIPLEGHPKLAAHKAAMLARPATQAALQAHDLTSV